MLGDLEDIADNWESSDPPREKLWARENMTVRRSSAAPTTVGLRELIGGGLGSLGSVPTCNSAAAASSAFTFLCSLRR